MTKVPDFVVNPVELDASARYAAILGASPSKGARSPLLWNAVFREEGMDIRFHPFDCTAAALPDLVGALREDARYIGGSVTMPYKSAIISCLDRLEPTAERIGAVNAIYRDGADLVGANTDGAAALTCALEALGDGASLRGSKVLILGTGGAGSAVAAFFAEAVGNCREVVLANRTLGKAEALAHRLGQGVRAVALPPSRDDVAGANVIVNCTSLGFSNAPAPGQISTERMVTALGATRDVPENVRATLIALAAAAPDALVFDIIYQPSNTMLLTLSDGLGLRTLNGKGMNLEQAVIAFLKAVPEAPDAARVRSVMTAVP